MLSIIYPQVMSFSFFFFVFLSRPHASISSDMPRFKFIIKKEGRNLRFLACVKRETPDRSIRLYIGLGSILSIT